MVDFKFFLLKKADRAIVVFQETMILAKN